MLFFLLISLVLAKIYVYAPDTLQAKINQKYSTNSIPYSLANFGNPPYGSSIVSRVYWPEKQDERNGCKPLSPIEYMDDPHPLDLPILLLTRGMCSFTTKVRNAQNIGVVAVLIVDYVDEDVNKIILIDDGTAGNIFIPSMLISKADGQLIIDEIEKDNHSHVMLSLTFMMPKSKSKVYYDL